ncbi:glycoside hydrolase family 38 C-terminal domain-containing protein [Bacteroides nordii]|uniref:glycoside hydrolase family 38 N-terminal domain-containing protein n=1 Tax=Bacteroides nordii TaxID=291645 RepID=UPI00399B8E3A
MIKQELSAALLALCLSTTVFGQSEDKKCIFISTSHLDTQWNWTAQTTIEEYIPNTMNQNYPLFEKYPDFQFNFEGGIHYMWMKEYYPQEYEKLKKYIAEGRWHISGGSINANDVMVPSAESIIRNFLYGQSYYKKEFGRKGGSDIMLPDCFGFPYSLPTLGKHCGITGFHTQKLSWGSAYEYKSLPPFGIWKGVDGSEIYAIFKGEAYDAHEQYNKDMSKDEEMRRITEENYQKYGLAAAFRYVGPRGDRGGGLKDNTTEKDERTPYWLQQSMNSDGPVKVGMWTPDAIFQYLDENRNDKYAVWDNELPMQKHGTGCYTSQTIMKYWNRKNELLADATEKASVAAAWMGGAEYPSAALTESWIRLLWHHFHDDLTGTSIPGAYKISYNDEVLVNQNLADILTGAVGALVRRMDTQVQGIPLVVYNPLSLERTDIVEASIKTTSDPAGIRVLDNTGEEVLSQITGYDANTGKLSFIFKATVASLGYATYEVRLNETSELTSTLNITNNTLENDRFVVTLNPQTGDVRQIKDKKSGEYLLSSAIRMLMFSDRSDVFPAWEIEYGTLNEVASSVDENVKVTIAEEGPLRVSLKVFRTKNGSEFVQYIRLADSGVNDRIDFVNEVNWQSRGQLLKVAFPLRKGNPKATYDLSIGAIERGNNQENLYEVAGHQWADLSDETSGVSILNDCKYGWDKPNNNTLRLTLIHTPATTSRDYAHHKDQDLGLNKFTYSVYGHEGKWSEDTQWAAASLNQPMLAFQAPKHTGALGKSFGFVSLNTAKVAVKALKKAEDSDEMIVRLYELTGNTQNDVELSFPTAIVSAREVNGIEEEIGGATYADNKLSFNIGRFQPKTFAVKLASPESDKEAAAPVSYPVTLRYNRDIMSYDDKKNNMSSDADIRYAYPAEQLSDKLMSDGIAFQLGSRELNQRNVLLCRDDEINIALPTVPNGKKIYILAASSKEAGTTAKFTLGSKSYSFHVPYWAETIGTWETEFNMQTKYCKENVAFTATHRHTKNGKNDIYGFMHMYKYAIPVTEAVSNLSVATNDDLYIFAVSLSDNENDDVTPVSEVTSLPMPEPLSDSECSRKLVPLDAEASDENGTNENRYKAIDDDLNTKWCVTNNPTPWLELVFAEPVDICHWLVMNAGVESSQYITSAFRLQGYENGVWIDLDQVTDNTLNKVHRYIPSFTTDRVRLQIDKGEQGDDGTTTRILEFAVYGREGGVGIEPSESSDSNFHIEGNYPNPFSYQTTIRCQVPEGASEITLHVYDCVGKVVDKCVYPVTRGGSQEFVWNNRTVSDGLYLYTISVTSGGKTIFSDTKKMIISKFAAE